MIGSVRVMAGAAVAVTVMALASTAQAKFDICNSSSDEIVAAFGYREDGEWTSSGWWTVGMGECVTVYSKTLRERYYYYYAEKINAQGDWGGDYVFCAVDDAFTIVGDQECKARGYDAYGFREIDVGERINDSIELTD